MMDLETVAVHEIGHLLGLYGDVQGFAVGITRFNNLPKEITQDILTRLPTESVLDCKLVCKPWRDLIRLPSFSRLHLTHLNSAANDSESTLCFQDLKDCTGGMDLDTFIQPTSTRLFRYVSLGETQMLEVFRCTLLAVVLDGELRKLLTSI
ncbi:putative F-box protein At3g17400 [Papaver somniferum]|uniref:putative F-box protein At3g17400 n=1 Tax=Papaver somniferum TaxID=3469 RepID=UPI000E6FD6F0|nr:putative F-box protein At3g17400 [Papaver somniferum]